MTLNQLLGLAVDGGLGILAYWLLEHPLAAWYAKVTEPDTRRWIAAGLTSLFAVAAWGAGIGMGYWAAPDGTAQAWIEAIFNIVSGVAVTFGAATMAHTKAMKQAR